MICKVCGNIDEWMVIEESEKSKLVECVVCDNIEVIKATNNKSGKPKDGERMKTKYKFIYFEQNGNAWLCKNNKSKGVLGKVEYYSSWRQYCYFPTVQAVYSAGCLNNIADFIRQLGKESERE